MKTLDNEELQLDTLTGSPTVTLHTPTGVVGTPTGNETYAGGGDIFLLKSSPLYVISFQTISPRNVASAFGITFHGDFYYGGHTGVYYDMVTTSTAGLYKEYTLRPRY